MQNNNKPKTILFLPYYICTLLDQTKPQHINLINSSKNSIRSVYHLFQCNLSGKYSQKIHISWTDLLFFLITTYNSTNKILFSLLKILLHSEAGLVIINPAKCIN